MEPDGAHPSRGGPFLVARAAASGTRPTRTGLDPMMRALAHPDMVYRYPIWAVGAAILVAALVAAVLLVRMADLLAPAAVRRRHNEVTSAILSIIGVTYAVLLAFVAMLAWQGFDGARAATSHEAAALLDLERTSRGLGDPVRSALRDDAIGYARAVVALEWPAQAEGRAGHDGDAFLDRLNRTATGLRPGDQATTNLHLLLLEALTRLRDARELRLLSAEPTIPGVVWSVLLGGGGLTLAFASLLGATSIRLHLVLSAMLATSGVLVLVMIVALSNPFRGDFRVSARPFEAALARMGEG